jgi:hypothetical protein
MAHLYRMKIRGSEFIINHNSGVTVGVYKTEREARKRMEDCRRDDLMLKTAKAGGKSCEFVDLSPSY